MLGNGHFYLRQSIQFYVKENLSFFFLIKVKKRPKQHVSLGHKFKFLSRTKFRFGKLGRLEGPGRQVEIGLLKRKYTISSITHLLSSKKGPSLHVLTLIWKISESLCCHPPDATISIPRSASGDITWQVCPKRGDSMSGSVSQVFKRKRAHVLNMHISLRLR